VGQERDGVIVRRTSHPTLQGANRARAQVGALGQYLLGEAGVEAMLSQQVAEGRRLNRAYHDP
jgi:hypothetical protein